jgi:photosystem II stability/assembly factor-like uncharacterized protein
VTLFLARRSLLLSAGVLLLPGMAHGALLTGYAALDTGAITVRHPGCVTLFAVAHTGSRLVAAGEHGVIIYSDDDGANWTQAHVPVNVDLVCIAFATPVVGWAAGHFGVVLNTTDAGQSWQVQLNGTEANALTLAAAQAAVAHPNDASPGLPFAMRRANFFMAAGPSKPFLCLLVLSPEKIFAFGAYRMAMFTKDGGKIWADWSLNIGDRLSNNLYAAAAIGADLYVVGEAGMVFRSSDGGATFPAVPSPSGVTLFGVVGASDNAVIVFGVAGNCFRSVDAGMSWSAIGLGTQDNLTAGRRLGNGHILIASEGGVLYRSVDNGQSFNPVPGVPHLLIFDIEATPDGSLVIAGQSGAVRLLGLTL